MKTRNYANEHSYFIPMIDAADIFKYSAAGTGLPLYKPYKKANGSSPMRADKDLFSSTFRFCLETAELECTYGSLKKGNFSQSVDDEIMLNGCTDALVCVTFDYAFREYNKFKWDSGRKGTLYVRAGYAYKDGVIIDQDGNKYEIADCACVCNHKLIAIITSSNTGRDNDERESVPVENNVLDSAVSSYFDYDESCRQYVKKKVVGRKGKESYAKIGNVKSANELRDYLYLNGFDCLNKKGEPVHYVRYKRSAGMSRENKCIFIREDMLKKMMKWGTLTDRNPTTNRLLKKYKVSLNDDVVSAEAYGALSLSSLEDMLHLDISNILFMRDVKCEFQTKGMNVTADESRNISAEAKWSRVENNLFDGEALLDESVFEQAGRSNKGMMLLRNRYFKGCAFNTKIQQWFKDNDITSVDQLNGVTLANDISEVRMIVTESCLKFCKMLDSETDDFESKIRFWAEWLGDDGCDFGIVKSEKPTPWLGGNLVRTSYQMLNTLCLDPGLVDMLMLPAAILKQRLRSDRNFFRYILSDFSGHSGEAEDTDDSIEYSSEKKQPDIYGFKDKLVCSLLDICPEFAETRMYQQFRSEWISKINDSIKRGKLLVHGTNAVLFGNGYEYLKTAINEGPKVKIIRIDQNQSSIFCPFFKDGQELMGIRSPHITMGNVLVLENRYNDEYRYFNLTNQIVCVNARNSNIQHILNGADYDSDTMLLTDNEMLIQGGKISKTQFPTPINKLSYDKATKSLTKIDIEIGKNKIGEIVNLSQKFNSVLWAMVFQSKSIPSEFSSREAQNEVYSYCAILEVLSNTEIDKAKRIYNIDAEKELHRLNTIYKKQYQPYFAVPDFFTFITTGKSAKDKSDRKVNACPMQYIYNRAFDDNVKRGKNGRPLSDIITDNSAGADIKTVNSIIKKAESVQNKRTALCARLHSNMYKIHNASVQNAISRETLSFFRSVRQEKLSEADIRALIEHIDSKGTDITESEWLLLAALCNSGTGDEMDFTVAESTKLYGMLKKNPPEADYDPDGIRKELYRMFGV
jgi:hypothetical protein